MKKIPTKKIAKLAPTYAKTVGGRTYTKSKDNVFRSTVRVEMRLDEQQIAKLEKLRELHNKRYPQHKHTGIGDTLAGLLLNLDEQVAVALYEMEVCPLCFESWDGADLDPNEGCTKCKKKLKNG